MESLRFALIGAGGIGKHLTRQIKRLEQGLEVPEPQRALPHFPPPEGVQVQLAGVYDESPEAAQTAANELETSVYPSLSALLEDETVQVVIIATPPFTHGELALQSLAHGKHVFCEKPMALQVEQCDAMLEASRRARRLLMVGQVLRLFPAFWHSNQLLQQGRIGAVWAISVRRTGFDLPLFGKGWRRDPARSGGLVIEMNVHELDYMRWIGGEVQQVFAQGIRPMPDTDSIQHWQGVLRFATGAIGALEASMLDTLGRYTVTIIGERGSIAHTGFAGELLLRTHDGQQERFDAESLQLPDPYLWELTAFVRAIALGEPLPFDGWDGRQAVALARACLRSIETGQVVAC